MSIFHRDFMDFISGFWRCSVVGGREIRCGLWTSLAGKIMDFFNGGWSDGPARQAINNPQILPEIRRYVWIPTIKVIQMKTGNCVIWVYQSGGTGWK